MKKKRLCILQLPITEEETDDNLKLAL